MTSSPKMQIPTDTWIAATWQEFLLLRSDEVRNVAC